jgi:hypothetical protein
MMKFPSASAGTLVPSGNSLAVTYPGVCGSRVGGTGFAPKGFTPAIKPSSVQSHTTP